MEYPPTEKDISLIHYGPDYFAAMSCTVSSFTGLQEEIVTAFRVSQNVLSKISTLRKLCVCKDEETCHRCIVRKEFELLLR